MTAAPTVYSPDCRATTSPYRVLREGTTITAAENSTLSTVKTYTVCALRVQAGQTSESRLGIYFYNARYNAPCLAPFIQAETLIPQSGNPLARDRYASVNSNPIIFSDPTGHVQEDNEMMKVNIFANIKMIALFYRIVLPLIIIGAFLGIASFNDRLRLLNSIGVDFVIRSLICLWFCSLYIRIARISSFGLFPNRKWSKSDVTKTEKYFCYGLILFFGLGCGGVTWWAINWFLPGLRYYSGILSIVNCVIIAFPLVKHYWVIKI